ncbi:hypothetical protein QE152_g4175 [Popillia japonica]|uniref:CCHC-type domain-containing protein n=1 Tax=Popillia japonica TaxID=7064 RepID=A0AAW1N1F2_POPJA
MSFNTSTDVIPGTSIAGGDLIESEVRTVDDLNNMNDNNSPQSFANVLKSRSGAKFSFPERDQAIVFDAIENSIKNDYIIALGELVDPKNIIFASRVSNNRICIYLSSKDLVESFMTAHGGIKLNNSIIPARRLLSPAKRIILSNVSPSLPHEILEKELKQMKLQVVSPVRFIGAGIPKEGYKHILSFRRQVYVVCNEHDKLPDSLVIQVRGNAFRVFLTTDEIRCFQCKRIGHVASKCPTNSDNSVRMETMDVSLVPLPDSPCPSIPSSGRELQELSTKENTDTSDIAPPSKKRQAEPSTPTESEPRALLVEESNSQCPKVVDTDRFLKPISKKKKPEHAPDSDILYSERGNRPDSPCPSIPSSGRELQELSTKENTDTSDIAPPSKKRQAEPSTPTESEPRALLVEESNSQCPKVVDTDRFLKPISKKKKPEHASDSDILYSEFKDIFSGRVEVIDFHNFCKFLEEVTGKQDTLAVARSYTNDIGSLIELLIRLLPGPIPTISVLL